jgi:hypothetical protein
MCEIWQRQFIQQQIALINQQMNTSACGSSQVEYPPLIHTTTSRFPICKIAKAYEINQ